jgi:hypothetical protein
VKKAPGRFLNTEVQSWKPPGGFFQVAVWIWESSGDAKGRAQTDLQKLPAAKCSMRVTDLGRVTPSYSVLGIEISEFNSEIWVNSTAPELLGCLQLARSTGFR